MTPKNDEVKIPMDAPNTFKVAKAEHADDPSNIEPCVHPFMWELIMVLSAKHPTWEFINTTRRVSWNSNGIPAQSSNRNYTDFGVFDGEQVLGTISKEWRHHGDSYTFNNHRMAAQRQRGGSTATKDLKKAVKLIGNSFYGLTKLERMEAAFGKSSAQLTHQLITREHGFKNEWSKVNNPVQAYVLRHWDEIVPHLPMRTDTAHEAIPIKKAEMDEVRRVHGAWGTLNGAVVITEGTQYMTSYLWEGNGIIHTQTSEQLPVAVKQGVGMLKLVKPGEYIEGVGMRIENDTYFVILERPTT